MHPVKLSPLHQVEYAVKDVSGCMQFFADVFGESEVEAVFSRVLTNPALEIRHCGFGKTVQQFCQPLMDGLPHSSAVQEAGNCVHNLCFLVESIDAIVANCRDADIETLIEFPMGDNWRQLIAEDNLQGNHQSYIFATRALLGFQLELAETPWITEPEPPIMLPAYGPQWAATGADSGNTLRAINVLVDDLEKTLHGLQSIFAGSLNLVQSPAFCAEGEYHYMVVELGQVPLVYIQPGERGELRRLLQQRGPMVHSLLAEVADLEHASGALARQDVATVDAAPVLLRACAGAEGAAPAATQVQSRNHVGVDFVLIGPQS